jgi:hypothetical protein
LSWRGFAVTEIALSSSNPSACIVFAAPAALAFQRLDDRPGSVSCSRRS